MLYLCCRLDGVAVHMAKACTVLLLVILYATQTMRGLCHKCGLLLVPGTTELPLVHAFSNAAYTHPVKTKLPQEAASLHADSLC